MDTVSLKTPLANGRFRLRIIVPAFPAFNIYSRIARRTTALGPVCIATAASKIPGWDVEVIDENNYLRFGPKTDEGLPDHNEIQKLRPANAVGFYGGLTSTIPRLYTLASEYKKMGVFTFAGGQHFANENIEDGLKNNIDLLIFGEAEDSIVELLPALTSGRSLSEIKGLAYLENDKIHIAEKRKPLEEFGNYPIPDFSLVRYAKITLYPISRVRGCGMDCEFCTVKGRARYATPERLMEQVISAVERWSANDFFIVDDLFGQDRQETLRLCSMLAEYQKKIGRRLYFTVQIRLDKAHDHELLSAMNNAGVCVVCIGFESPIPQELKAMNKHLKPEDMIKMTREFHKHGFMVHGMFIFGYPMRNKIELNISVEERIRYFRTFVKKAKIDTLQVLLPVPLPGTEMTQRLRDENRVFPLKHVGWEYYDGNFPTFIPDAPLTPETMLAATRKIMSRFYRFEDMFSVGFNTISFPMTIFWLHNLKTGWHLWYKPWRNSIIRFGGWLILRNWVANFKQGSFMSKLNAAKKALETPAEL